MNKYLIILFSLTLLILESGCSVDNYLLVQQFDQPSCSGIVLTSVFYQTNQCFQGILATCNSQTNIASLSNYNNTECEGSPSTMKFQLGCNSLTGFSCIEQLPTDIPSTVGSSNYFNSTCQNDPYYVELKTIGICTNSAVVQCNSTELTISKFENQDCTGQPSNQQHILIDTQCKITTNGSSQIICNS
ncbi:hypothetical protein PPL_08493 [Heterostelium album PN500]|uniref:Transmembrane protein n=1 Tax=Heterostelium pallidum (strain ATCC 26659 / Pp 5 / PN500) TaxID=670386 RepID=D3BIC4_HETP5|nr:hypothetical protein PPL_08493 [Heterostelium album PN500]EFA79024.1 hypothetical protein PPL_08493 [Heterostelium album PN500]|eukprot:XP_020431147.1 hypothetical protein PPL_08493 [Heterostelium album PN500]